jgi:Mycothiol maleylpyruvate isomerase N-terminal domain
MPLTFAGTLDRDALLRATDALTELVSAPEVAEGWDRESALPGMTVGGVTRHLVSQPESAVEFLCIQPVPPHALVLSLADLYGRTDWFAAPVDAEENTSIRDDFNEMSAGGQEHSLAILEQARAELPGALAAAGPTTYVPWQDCCLATDDFLVVRLMEVVVHADDLAASIGQTTPRFDDDVLHPALALLAMLGARRQGQDAVVRALSRAERAGRPASAF